MNKHFQEAELFYKENGNLNPNKETPLYKWLKNIRARRNKNIISQGYVDRLDNLGIDWNPNETKWNERFEETKLFYTLNGHLNIKSDSPLNKWLNSNRLRKLNNNISKERQEKLNSIGIDWEPFNNKWDRNIIVAQEFYNRKSKYLLK